MEKPVDPKTLLRKERSSRGQGCCAVLCSYLFCCCIRSNVHFTQPNYSALPWKEKWKKIASKLNPTRLVNDKVFRFLLQLAADQFTKEDYEGLQIAPNLHKASRDDLEFYVPQLVNFILFGDYEEKKSEDLLLFLLNACMIDFYFAHRVHWFLWSNDFLQLEEPKVHIEKYFPHRLVKAVEIASRSANPLCMGNAPELQIMLQSCRSFHPPSTVSLTERIGFYNLLRHPLDDDPHYPRELQIPPFPMEAVYDNYMSTMWFVQELTDISIKLLHATDKKERLIEALQDINRRLPAAVYLPFNKAFTRECAVLHIPISEVKVFKTKERAPFLICIEIYKPYDELQLVEHEEVSQSMCSLSDEESVAQQTTHERRESVLMSASLSYNNYQQIMSEATEQLRTSHVAIPRMRTESMIEPASPIIEKAEEEVEEEVKAGLLDDHYSKHVISFAAAKTKKGSRHRSALRQTIAYVYGEEPDHTTLNAQSTPSESARQEGVFGESSKQQKDRLQSRSPFGHFRTWNVIRVIVKSGDDLKQEQLAMQLISQFHQIFRQAKLKLWLRPYEILATGPDCGILECVADAMSIDSLKKTMPKTLMSLSDFFKWQFGGEKSETYKAARRNFVESFAAYSLVCFILQIKDRHNGNILLDNQGHVIHIDFGFLISNAPGKGIKFEQAPFKLTNEFVEVMGGARRSSLFMEFRKLCVKGFIALRRRQQKIWILLEMMRTGSGACLPCFVGGEQAMLDLRERFNPREEMSNADCREYINRLIDDSLDHWTTTWYDRYQRWCQNIL